MKSLCLCILLVFSTTSTAQIRISNPPADLIIVKSKLSSIVSVVFPQRDPPPVRDDSHLETKPPSSELQGKAELEVQNNGTKSIKSIDWTLLLIKEVNSKVTIQSYLVRSKTEVRPGETVKVTGWFRGTNLQEWRKPLKDGLLQTKAEINLIKYADGTTWVPVRP